MSTKPWRRNGFAGAAALLATGTLAQALAGCAGPAPEPGHGFGEVRLHRVQPPPPPAYLVRPAAVAAAAAPRIDADPAAAAERVRTLLTKDGFTVESRSEGEVRRLAATRMAEPGALRQEAACALQAMHRPDFSASDLDVRLAPGAGGLAVQATGRFVLVDTNLISGELTRQTCRSNGVLEAAVRRAAAG